MRRQVMRTTALLLALAPAAALAACGDVKLKSYAEKQAEKPSRYSVAATLACPDREGDLKLIRSAPDGQSCAYGGADGREVELLRLGNVEALDALGERLKQERPVDLETPSAPPEPPAPPEPLAGDAERSADEAERREERTEVNLPGMHVKTDGDRAEVKMFGLHIDADDTGGKSRVEMKGGFGGNNQTMRVSASDEDGAIVEVSKGFSDRQKTLLLTGKEPAKSGWRTVGYYARGPRSGPYVAAVVRTRQDGDIRMNGDGAELFDDADDLVKANVAEARR